MINIKSFAYMAVISATVLSFNTAHSFAFGNDEIWTSGFGQGVSEAVINKGPGNQIMVTCDSGADRDATGISFMLGGNSPKETLFN